MEMAIQIFSVIAIVLVGGFITLLLFRLTIAMIKDSNKGTFVRKNKQDDYFDDDDAFTK